MRRILAAAGIIGALGIASVAFAQTALPEGVTEEQMTSALKDLSAVYGAPVVRLDQAKAICNEEKYITDCAQIGKKHDLFSDERTKQVDTLLNEFKGEAVEKLKQCSDAACLVEVATSIARSLNSGNPSVARAVELTPQKVGEKKTIVETAKSLGVDIEACKTMDPDAASVELLRSCARLAKHENIQKYIPQETKNRANESDAAIALKESLESGKVSCGDNTLEGCGNFCLAPSAEARAKGDVSIPPVCRQIATQFFGANGIKELEKAYTTVQDTFDSFTDRAQNIAFTTADGRTLSDPGAIGRYMEEAGSRGDVEAVSLGMDFLMKKGFVTGQDRDFALEMVKKVKERGPVDFGACRADPSLCSDLISEKDRGQFTTMGEVEKVMRSEMEKRGISDPSRCSSDPSVGQLCLEAARAALPQIEKLAEASPQAQVIVSDIRQKIRFGEAGLEARSKVEERFRTAGDFSIDGNRFNSIAGLETFCRSNPQQCLTGTAREGFISKDIAAEKYERTIESSYNYNSVPPEDAQRTQFTTNNFNKEDALQQFKQWLDNPQGPPPMPPGTDPRSYEQYQPYPPYPQYQTPYSPYQRPSTDQNRCQYAQVMPVPCKAGEYRQESVNEFGCSVFGSCIPFDTKTEPPRIDGKNICPALPTVESCSAGEEKTVAFSSPECGTYYSCRAAFKPPVDDQNRTTASCERYGSGWRSMDSSGNCFSPSATEYRTVSGTLNSCASAPVYGCSSSVVPPSIVPTYPTPSGQREQVWNNVGLRSWIRTDADQSRIESLKQACASVVSQANIWLPSAGTQSSADFGMPDPGKCAKASSCSSTQYFDGTVCVTSTTEQQTNTSITGSCSSEFIGLLGSGCHSMGSGWFNGEMTKYVLSGSQTVRSCTAEYVSGCSGGSYYNQTQTSCSSGQYWNGNSCVQTSTTDCTSGQYWNGSACVSSTQSTTGTYDTASAQQGCASAGGTWDSAANYCRMPSTNTNTYTPPSGSTYTPPPSGTYTPPPDSTYTAPPSGSYTPPAGSTYTPPPTTESYTPPPSTESAPPPPPPPPPPSGSDPVAYLFCPEGHNWNGAYCTLSPPSPFERYTASALSAIRSLFSF